MNKLNTRQKILLGLLVIIVFIYVYTAFFSKPAKPKLPGDSFSIGTPTQSKDVVKSSKDNIKTNIIDSVSVGSVKVKEFYGEWGKRDPFFREIKRKVIVEEKQSDEVINLVLTGVHWANGKGIAVINNKIYYEGDSVDGKKLVKVEKNYIVLRNGQKEFILKLGEKK